jgi:putative cell wall-binding protein
VSPVKSLVIVGVLLLLSGSLGTAAHSGIPSDAERGAVSRIAGLDRFHHAVLVSQSAFPTSKIVYLANGETFADALTAGAVAGLHHAPLLLTRARSISTGTTAEILRLQPDVVVVVGGPVAVNDVILRALGNAAPEATEIVRIGGPDRFAVSRALVSDPRFGAASASEIFLASGRTFPDAIAAAPAAVRSSAPVLAIDGLSEQLDPVDSALLFRSGVKSVGLVGGPASISSGLHDDLSLIADVTRYAGPDRFATSAELSSRRFPTSSTVFLASGSDFPDALTAGPVAAEAGAPVLLVRKDCIPRLVAGELDRLKPSSIVVLGGEQALSTEIESLRRCVD